MLIDAVDQKFTQGPTKLASHSFMLSDAPAGNIRSDWMAGTAIIWRQLYSHLYGGWCWLLAGTSAGIVSHNTYLAHLCDQGLLHSIMAEFQEQDISFLRPGPGNLDSVPYTVFT